VSRDNAYGLNIKGYYSDKTLPYFQLFRNQNYKSKNKQGYYTKMINTVSRSRGISRSRILAAIEQLGELWKLLQLADKL